MHMQAITECTALLLILLQQYLDLCIAQNALAVLWLTGHACFSTTCEGPWTLYRRPYNVLQDSRTEGGQGHPRPAPPDVQDNWVMYRQRRQTKLIYSNADLHAQVISWEHMHFECVACHQDAAYTPHQVACGCSASLPQMQPYLVTLIYGV